MARMAARRIFPPDGGQRNPAMNAKAERLDHKSGGVKYWRRKASPLAANDEHNHEVALVEIKSPEA